MKINAKMFASCYYILYLWCIEIKEIITTLKTKIMKANLTVKEISTGLIKKATVITYKSGSKRYCVDKSFYCASFFDYFIVIN